MSIDELPSTVISIFFNEKKWETSDQKIYGAVATTWYCIWFWVVMVILQLFFRYFTEKQLILHSVNPSFPAFFFQVVFFIFLWVEGKLLLRCNIQFSLDTAVYKVPTKEFSSWNLGSNIWKLMIIFLAILGYWFCHILNLVILTCTYLYEIKLQHFSVHQKITFNFSCFFLSANFISISIFLRNSSKGVCGNLRK